jgi:hypothetical protein
MELSVGSNPTKEAITHATQFPTLNFRRNASSTCAEPFQRSLYFGFSVLHRANQSLSLLKPNSAIPYCLNSKSPNVEQRAMIKECAVVAGLKPARTAKHYSVSECMCIYATGRRY